MIGATHIPKTIKACRYLRIFFFLRVVSLSHYGFFLLKFGLPNSFRDYVVRLVETKLEASGYRF